MKQKTLLALSLIVSVSMLASCGKEQQTDESGNGPLTGDCTFKYDQEATTVSWTAYKYTEKAAVGGSFHKFQIKDTAAAPSALGVFEKASFSIDTDSVDSGNDGRDTKIKKEFFGNMSSQTIEGSVKSLEGDSGVMVLKMNGAEKEVPVSLSVDGRDVVLTGSINVGDWNADGPLKALNKVCEALHTGPDKVSKLWPDVDIKLETSLKADCK
ncbi:MAG: YceI family protein [Leptospiraceae bacterium]|nr:YceI family protein [Leptospiraceae bacterium]MCB1303502.1 YceI family protein [Leptospiraceae bacterium]